MGLGHRSLKGPAFKRSPIVSSLGPRLLELGPVWANLLRGQNHRTLLLEISRDTALPLSDPLCAPSFLAGARDELNPEAKSGSPHPLPPVTPRPPCDSVIRSSQHDPPVAARPPPPWQRGPPVAARPAHPRGGTARQKPHTAHVRSLQLGRTRTERKGKAHTAHPGGDKSARAEADRHSYPIIAKDI